MRTRWLGGVVIVLAAGVVATPAGACSICDPANFAQPTFRQEAALEMAKAIFHGTIANPRATGGVTGETDLHVKTVLRDHPVMKGKTSLVLPRYLPVSDKSNPPHYLFFADVDKGKIDPYRGVVLRGPETVAYVKKALALDPKNSVENLKFFFDYLQDPDPEVARDAFFEFAKANDADIARAAPRLDADKLRAWVKDPKTPPQKLGVYALLLGSCGKAEDVEMLRSLLDSKEERYANSVDGLLAGYMQRKPREGWEFIQSVLADEAKPLTLRLAVLRTIRFCYGAQPKESKGQVLKAMRTLLGQPEMADLAIEDLRAWKLWDLNAEVFGRYGRKGYDSALVRRGILRYALSGPATKETTAFLGARRADNPEEVKEIEESLKLSAGR
jgi:hypothetical protein